MPHADVNGQRLYYEDTGGDGPPLVLSHGLLMDHEMFVPQVAEFGAARRVITWDQRGFGRTESDGQPFTYWDSARDLFGLLDRLGIERAVFGGMSQGGFVSLRAGLLHPDRVRALILIDTHAGAEDPDRVAAYQAMLDSWLEHGYQEELASLVAAMIIGDDTVSIPWKAKWAEWPHERLREAGAALLGREDITDRMPEIDAPVLIVHGTDDLAIDVEEARRLRDLLPDCRGMVIVDGAPHASSLTHPDVVNPALRDFLDGLPA